MGPGSLPRNGESGKESLGVARGALLELPESLRERIRSIAPTVSIAELARLVEATSRTYTRERDRLDEAASADAHLARLRFFLPRDLPKAMAVFRDLDRRGRLPRRASLRVLDLGAGLGTTTLSLARYAFLAGVAERLEVTAVDLDARALGTMERLAHGLEGFAEIALTTVARDLRRVASATTQRYDVITIGLALNELADDADSRASVLATLSRALTDDGVLVVLEPALRETTRALMRVRDVVAERALARIEGPCVGPARCPLLENERDWCHAEIPGALDPELADVAKRAGLRDEDPTFSWLALARKARTEEPLTRRRLRLVSAPLGSKGKTEIHACGREGLVRFVELDRDAKHRGNPLSSQRRGALIEIAGTEAKSGFERVGASATHDDVVD